MMIIMLLLFSVCVPVWGYASAQDMYESRRTHLGIGPQVAPTSDLG